MDKVIIITGDSSGIGKETALILAKAGYKIYGFSRREFSDPLYTHIRADVTDPAVIEEEVRKIVETEGKIDILINCAGAGISGAIEFTEPEDAHMQMNVGFFGAVNCTHAVLGYMRKAGGGRIVNISSMAAPVPIPFQAFYSSAKAAMNAYTCALANEVKPFGISVCALQPGDMYTGFGEARKKSEVGDEEYNGRISHSVKVMENDEKNGMDPKVAAAYIAKIACQKKVKPLYAVGFKYKLFYLIMKLLPIRFSNWILGQMYQ